MATQDSTGKISRPGWRTLFISDVHLGTRGCKAAALAEFLKQQKADRLYLVGDIVDGWRLKRRWYWHPSHQAVLDEILDLARSGTEVFYIPGNHDEVFRPYAGQNFAEIEVRYEAIHTTADGRSLLVMHGDMFDGAARWGRIVSRLGDWAYDATMWTSDRLAATRKALGLSHWSLAAHIKRTAKTALEIITRFEGAAAREAEARGFDGIICGHIHQAALKRMGRVTYANDGDWVDSCTALAETHDGRLVLLDAHGQVIDAEPQRSPALPTPHAMAA
jgi:UDP-2,3-diacylglucosamine pyrophosphatase LpxH